MPRKTTRDVSEPRRCVRHSDTCISPSVRIALLINCFGDLTNIGFGTRGAFTDVAKLRAPTTKIN